jgi:calcineurin-like phosphoesterase family protein
MENLRSADANGFQIFHLGDASFNLGQVIEKYGSPFPRDNDHVIILGNHDRYSKQQGVYKSMFRGGVIGTEKTWKRNFLKIEDNGRKLLLSHQVFEDLDGAEWNIHGHVHNNLSVPQRDGYISPEKWVVESKNHLNACVEVCNYRPMTLLELISRETQY